MTKGIGINVAEMNPNVEIAHAPVKPSITVEDDQKLPKAQIIVRVSAYSGL